MEEILNSSKSVSPLTARLPSSSINFHLLQSIAGKLNSSTNRKRFELLRQEHEKVHVALDSFH